MASDDDRPEGRREQKRPRRSDRGKSHRGGAPAKPPVGLKLIELDQIEVRIEKLVAGGDGLARYEGIPIFVPRSAPGDLVRVELRERRPDYGRAEIVSVLEAGPGRREPPCPYFERCGGCDLQHLDDTHQLRYKAEAVRETLERLGHIEMPSKLKVLAGEPWGYRLRTQLQVAETLRGREAGYFARGSHDLVPVERCGILVGELEAILPRLPRLIRDQTQRRIDLAAGDDGVSAAPVVEGLPHGEITATIGDLVYTYDARCFFQGHRQLLPALVDEVVGKAEGELAFDLYAGVGLFSLPLARCYGRVVAVEGDRIAARFGRTNAKRNKIANVEVETSSIDGWLGRETSSTLIPQRVVADPPRSGLSGLLRRWLLKHRPANVTYVSCHPAALARDLRQLGRAYRLDSLTFIDLFPQTGHMEVIAQLEVSETA